MGSSKVAPEEKNGEQPKKNLKENAKDKDKPKPKGNSFIFWLIKILIITVILSCCFSVITEVVYNAIYVDTVRLTVAILLVLLIIFLAIVSDMIGVAVTACDEQPFHAMSSKKVKGARMAVTLCQNADKVASIISDIVGDVCGIISGSSGFTIALIILQQSEIQNAALKVLIPSAVAAVIAALTITGKAVGKRIALEKSQEITFGLAKVLSLFKKN